MGNTKAPFSYSLHYTMPFVKLMSRFWRDRFIVTFSVLKHKMININFSMFPFAYINIRQQKYVKVQDFVNIFKF